MVVVRALRFKYVLIASQGVPVVHVSQLFDELIHLVVVEHLLRIDHLCLFFENIVKLRAYRQVEGIVDFENRCRCALTGRTSLADLSLG